jgi:hypothetical protein
VDFTSLNNQKSELEKQLSGICELLDGPDNPAVADKINFLEVRKAELSGSLERLTSEADSIRIQIEQMQESITKCAGGFTDQLLNKMLSQQFFYIKNKEKIIFDSHTGVIFPNTHYFDDILKWYNSNMPTEKFDTEIKTYKNHDIHGYSFNFPGTNNFKYYFASIKVYANKYLSTRSVNNIISDKSSSLRNVCIQNVFKDGTFVGDYAVDNDNCFSFPFCDKFVSDDILTNNNIFTPKERAQKILNLFIQEGWIPKFDDEELTTLYEKMYVIRPALVKQLAEINETLAAMPAPKVGFADGIDFKELIKNYDLAAIRNSHVQYYDESIRWFDSLLTNLDAFILEHADLLSEAQTLTNRLIVAHHDDEYLVLTERAEYLTRHLDFGVETLQSKLIAFKNEAVAGRDRLADAQDLASLREIEKLEQPDFYLVAEHTSGMVKRQLVGVDWFREHKELAATLIELHEAWRKDFHEFEHTTREHFIQKCKDKSIEELADGWFAEWRKERLLLEEHILPLMKAGIEKVIPVEVVIDAVEVLRTNIRDQLAKFFFDKRIAIHFKLVLEPRGELQERLLKDAELAKINAQFQKALEELLFSIASSEGRLFLVSWAKDWYDVLIGEILAFIELDTLQEQIARNTLDEFRAMKRRNLESFQADARSNAEAREQKFEQLNELIGRIHADLVRKNGKENE